MHRHDPHPAQRHQRHIRPPLWLLLLVVALLTILFPGSAVLAQSAFGDLARAASPLQYMAWVQQASTAEVQAERERLIEGANDSDPVVAAVRLGLLLSMSPIASPDTEQEALAQLAAVRDQPATPGTNVDYRIFAAFLHDHLQQRHALRRADASEQETNALRHANTLLQDQIEALTTLEEQLVEREQEKEQEEQQAQDFAPEPEPEL